MYYCKKAYQVLKNGGLLVLLVSESFLSDDFSNKGDIEEINHMFNLIVQFSLPADAFKEYGVTSFRTKAMILQKKSQYVTEIIYVFLTIFLYLLKCPQSLILSALRAFCFCGKPHISRSIFLYFRYQTWLKSW